MKKKARRKVKRYVKRIKNLRIKRKAQATKWKVVLKEERRKKLVRRKETSWQPKCIHIMLKLGLNKIINPFLLVSLNFSSEDKAILPLKMIHQAKIPSTRSYSMLKTMITLAKNLIRKISSWTMTWKEQCKTSKRISLLLNWNNSCVLPRIPTSWKTTTRKVFYSNGNTRTQT